MEGDVVVVRLLPKTEGDGAAETRVADRSAADDDELTSGGGGGGGAKPFAPDQESVAATEWGDEPTSTTSKAATAKERRTGVVVGIVKRAWRPVVCVLEPDTAMGNTYLVEPLDMRIPKINISTRQVRRRGRITP